MAKFAEIEVRKQDGCRERNWKGNGEIERGMLVGWGWGGITRVKSGLGVEIQKGGKGRKVRITLFKTITPFTSPQ